MLIPTNPDHAKMHRAVVIQRLIAQQQQQMRQGQERGCNLSDLAVVTVANAYRRKAQA